MNPQIVIIERDRTLALHTAMILDELRRSYVRLRITTCTEPVKSENSDEMPSKEEVLSKISESTVVIIDPTIEATEYAGEELLTLCIELGKEVICTAGTEQMLQPTTGSITAFLQKHNLGDGLAILALRNIVKRNLENFLKKIGPEY